MRPTSWYVLTSLIWILIALGLMFNPRLEDHTHPKFDQGGIAGLAALLVSVSLLASGIVLIYYSDLPWYYYLLPALGYVLAGVGFCLLVARPEFRRMFEDDSPATF